MTKKRLEVDWDITPFAVNLKPALIRFRRYLNDIGLRTSTIDTYIIRVNKFLDFAQSDNPPVIAFEEFRDHLHSKHLSRSSLNNYSFAIRSYYKMIGTKISFAFIKPNDTLPYYFDEDDVLKIFSMCHNLKHLTMLKTLFFGCLRASELCSLDDCDVDLKYLTIRLREAKGGKDGIANISDECANLLRQYLLARPSLNIDGRMPLFYTDFGRRWDRKDLYRMFMYYKKKAGIEKAGGVHVFARHTPATIMVANGCDIRIIQEVLRHSDIRTTLRYAHVSDKTKREKYEKYLTL